VRTCVRPNNRREDSALGQITITLPPELEKEIEEYLGFERDEEDLSEPVKGALTADLEAQRSQLEIINPDRPHRFLQFPAASKGSGVSDVSANHDKYLAEDLMRRKLPE